MSDMTLQHAATVADDRLPLREGNALLGALSDNSFSQLQRHLRRRDFPKDTLLWDIGESADHVYFPHSGLISITMSDGNGHGIEVGSIGSEGGAGLRAGVIGGAMPTRATVQIGGSFSIISAKQFGEALRQSDEIVTLAALACDWMLLQAQQTAVCNATHGADTRFARWLLLAAMRSGNDTLTMTQEELSAMLGVRRTTATLIAQRLHVAGAIDYSRGKIRIRDRDVLQTAACSCCAALGKQRWPSTRLAAWAAGRAEEIDSATSSVL
jgi:CRP-like cAMP-binding protein